MAGIALYNFTLDDGFVGYNNNSWGMFFPTGDIYVRGYNISFGKPVLPGDEV